MQYNSKIISFINGLLHRSSLSFTKNYLFHPTSEFIEMGNGVLTWKIFIPHGYTRSMFQKLVSISRADSKHNFFSLRHRIAIWNRPRVQISSFEILTMRSELNLIFKFWNKIEPFESFWDVNKKHLFIYPSVIKKKKLGYSNLKTNFSFHERKIEISKPNLSIS
jgi:hypothetical protein